MINTSPVRSDDDPVLLSGIPGRCHEMRVFEEILRQRLAVLEGGMLCLGMRG
jgi:hypothetical protein